MKLMNMLICWILSSFFVMIINGQLVPFPSRPEGFMWNRDLKHDDVQASVIIDMYIDLVNEIFLIFVLIY